MKITSCRFVLSAFRPEDEPAAPGPDVVFVGRSNVGKSSLINRLLGTKNLARTSSTPGRTQSVNFYRVNEAFHFVDLPGYGYAAVPEQVRQSWRPLAEGALDRRRERIVLAVLVADARHGMTDLDRLMLRWLGEKKFRCLVVATKADKLSGNERAAAERAWSEREASPTADPAPVWASATTGLGIREIWKQLDRALAGRTGRGEGAAWTSGN